MKKIFTFFLVLAASMGIVYASDTQVDGIWYDFNSRTKTASVTYRGDNSSHYNEYSGEVIIPENVTYNGITYSVTSIGKSAFNGCSSLTSVTIPESVTSIGSDAFSGCSSLTSVTINSDAIVSTKYSSSSNISDIFGSQVTEYIIGDDVNGIGSYAFNGCSSLLSVTIPNSVTSIGEWAFYGCSSLTSVTIPNGVTSIKSSTFSGCSSLTSVTIPNSVTSIESSTFSGCSSLTSVAIPNSVTSIGKSAFNGCSSLTSVTIPNNVTSIRDYTFQNCSSLTSVTIPNGVTSIGYKVFYGCSSLTSVTINSDAIVSKKYSSSSNISDIFGSQVTEYIIGDDVNGIGSYAFYGCSSLLSVTIPNSVTSIGSSAFYGCSSLTSITIPNGVTSIGSYTFYDCSSLASVTIPNNATSIGDYAFYNCSKLTSVAIPNSVTSIGKSAFSGCSSLTSITIPNSVTSIGDGAFSDCSSLTSVTIPNGVTSIKSSTFSGCSSLTSVTIPESVTSIGSSAFGGCSSLTSVTIPESVTSIGSSAFSGCSSLTSVTIPNSVTSIGEWAFYGCSGLTSVTIPNGVTSIGISTFSGCSSLTSVTIPESVTSIGYGAFEDCSSLTSITIPNGVTSIGNEAFYGCSSLTSVEWNAKNCQNFSNELSTPFYSARTQITSFIIGDSVQHIPSYLCYCMNNLTSLTIPNGVTSIGERAFHGCSSLTSVTILNGVTNIGGAAFYGCSGLTSVTIPNGVTSIGGSAFWGCSGLTSVTIPNSVTSIELWAFHGCKKLNEIYCYATEPPVTYEYAFENLSYLYVPCDYLDKYKSDRVFGLFKYIRCIKSEDVTTDDLVVNPGTNDVTITWPIEDGAATYTIMIEKDGKVICTLTFNVDGKLLNIAFAPGRDGNRSAQYAEQTVNGYRFTVTGLDEGSVYTYSLVVKDRGNDTIQFYSGEFRTWSVYDRTVKVEYDAKQGKVTGAGRYLLGETATLTAIPNEGSRFVGWGDGNTDNPRTLVVTQDTTLTAIFEVLTYDVTVTCDPTQGTVTGSGTYNHGDVATLTVIPNEGYRFVGWEDDNTDNPRTLVVTQDTTLTAIFEVLTYDVTVTCDPTQGTVTGSGTYNHGDVATLTAIPNDGSRFVGWGDGNTDNPRTLVVTQDITLTALFEVLTYDVTVTCDPTQGTVTGSGTYNHGDVATLTAIPNEGYEFVRWSNEVVVNPYTFVIFENVIITAEFKDVVNTSVENTRTNTSTAKKLLRNGQFIIVRDGVEYNAVGQEM